MLDQATRDMKNEWEMNVQWKCIMYLQTLQVRLRQGTLGVSGFTARFEIASKLAAWETLREGPSTTPPDGEFAPSQIPDFCETWKHETFFNATTTVHIFKRCRKYVFTTSFEHMLSELNVFGLYTEHPNDVYSTIYCMYRDVFGSCLIR